LHDYRFHGPRYRAGKIITFSKANICRIAARTAAAVTALRQEIKDALNAPVLRAPRI